MGKYSDAFKKGVARGNATTETRATVSERLRALRAKSGYTQKQVAELANIDPATYAGYENKISTPALAALVRIADVYQVSLDYIAGRTENTQGLYAEATEHLDDNDLNKRIEKIERDIQELKSQ